MVPCLYLLVHGGYMSVPGGYLVLGVLLSCSGQLKTGLRRRRKNRIETKKTHRGHKDTGGRDYPQTFQED